MKKSILFGAGLLSLTCLFSSMEASAQENQEQSQGVSQNRATNEKEPQIPNLTDEQRKKMKEIRMRSRTENVQLKNQMNEREAHLKTLESSEKPDMNEINKTIDELTGIKATMMKKDAASKQEIRSMLTPEQRLAFDSREHGQGRKPASPPPAKK